MKNTVKESNDISKTEARIIQYTKIALAIIGLIILSKIKIIII